MIIPVMRMIILKMMMVIIIKMTNAIVPVSGKEELATPRAHEDSDSQSRFLNLII